MLHIGLRQSYKGHVATATKRSLRFCGAQLDPSHGTGGLGSAGAVMTSLYWNGSAFAPVNKTAAQKEAVVLRLETAFKAADATPSLRYRGIRYLRQNGFAA